MVEFPFWGFNLRKWVHENRKELEDLIEFEGWVDDDDGVFLLWSGIEGKL